MFPWEAYAQIFDRIADNAENNEEQLWETVNATASYIADYIRSMGGTSATDAVDMGTFVQGYARCNFIDADAIQHTDVRTAYRLSSVAQDGNLLFSNQYVIYRLYRDSENYPIAISSPSLNYSTSNGGYYYTATGSTTGWLFHGTFGQLANDPATTMIQVYLENRSNETTFSYALTSSPSAVRLDSAQVKLSNTWSNADIYLPQLIGNKSYTDARQILTDYYNTNIVLIDPDAELIVYTDLPDFQDATFPTETETESETSGSGCNCNCTTIYVNADGSLTIQNEVTGSYTLSLENNADLSLAINAAAGAFGAGAIVIDPDAAINFDLDAGAFATGAFGAGAIANADVDINGELSVDEISGEVSLSASEISFDGSLDFSGDMNLTGGDINIDQSGGTITNNYYVQDPSESAQEPFTIDYDEVLSEGELESILTQETYYIPELVTETDYLLEVSPLPSVPDLPAEVTQLSGLVAQESVDFISDVGLTPIYAPLAIFSIVCFLLRGAR